MVLANIKSEILMASRFAIVGMVATVVHVSVVWLLVTQRDESPLLLNLLAFLMAFVVSFVGQYFWTFRSEKVWYHALVRFFAVAFSAFCLNTLTLGGLLYLGWLSDATNAVIAAMVVPLFSYVLGRFWAFA